MRLPSRKLIGATRAGQAEPGTIRGDLGISNAYNLVHGSDSPESAAKELALFFSSDELLDWTPTMRSWMYDLSKGSPE